MTDNGNGTYTIKNSQTGETKTIGANELGNYGLAAPTPSYKPNMLNTILSTGGAIGGGILGGAAGVGAGAMVPGADLTGVPEAAGGYAGGVAGAGVGAGAGNALADFIRSLTGDKTVNAQQTINNTPDQVKSGAAAEAIGLPLAKGLGFIAHPIAPFIDMVDKKLASSAKTVNIGDLNGLLSTFKDQLIPKLTKDGYGPEAQDTYNSLASRITGMTQSRLPHVPADAGVTPDINSLTLPISEANGIKRDLYTLAKNTYSGIRKPTDVMSPLEQSGAADFAKLLKTNIGQQEPAVNIPNKIAKTMYKVPQTLGGLSSILSFGQPQAARAISTVESLPFKTLQKIIPQNGGYLRQLFPGLFQAGSSLGNQGQ